MSTPPSPFPPDSTLTLSPHDRLLNLLHTSFPAAFPAHTKTAPPSTTTTTTTPSTLTTPALPAPVQGENTLAAHLGPAIFPHETYTAIEQAEVAQWLTLSARLSSAEAPDLLETLNAHLATRTTVLGAKPSIADLALYARLAPLVKTWTPEQRTGERGWRHVVRFVDFVEGAPLYGLRFEGREGEKVSVDVDEVVYVVRPVDPRVEKERLKREKAEAAAAAASTAGGEKGETKTLPERPAKGTKEKLKEKVSEATDALKSTASSAAAALPPTGPQKKEKKEKKPKAAPATAGPPPPGLSPSLIDLRIGHILHCAPHPNADSLYVSQIACGDPAGTPDTSLYPPDNDKGEVVRTICSGLNGLVPLEEMQGRWVVVVCNLKPVTMRGIKSAGMVLAASPRNAEGHAGPVELVTPHPASADHPLVPGERVFFEGWDGGEPEKVLNPKKKVWEQLQPGFTTSEGLEVVFEPAGVAAGVGLKEGGKGGRGRLVTRQGGWCGVGSLRGATVR